MDFLLQEYLETSISRSETHTQKNIENESQKVAVESRDVVLSLAFVPGSGPASPSAGQQLRMEGY